MALRRRRTRAEVRKVEAGWGEIAGALRREIEAGEVKVGGQMPTEPSLMHRFGASRYAVRRALSSLQEQGLVRIEQGRGTFVHDGFLVSYRLGERARFTNVLIENQITPGQEILSIEIAVPDEEVARSLALSFPTQALRMELLGYANGQVVKHDTNYFPLPRFDGFQRHLRQTNSVTEALASYGIGDYRRSHTSIVGRLPTPLEARLLRQLPSQPVFECFRMDVDPSGAPILCGRTIFSCERVRLVMGDRVKLP
jgi:GntR family phosphonate transport system transcriptional regulator